MLSREHRPRVNHAAGQIGARLLLPGVRPRVRLHYPGSGRKRHRTRAHRLRPRPPGLAGGGRRNPAATLPTYDPAKGRLTSLAFSGGTDTFGYDPTSGRVTSIATADGVTLSYAYDGPLLKTTTWAGPVAGSVARTYDADFRLATETDAGGSPVAFQYDNDGLLTGAGALTITRDPATGFVTSSTLGSTTETRTYDPSYGEEQSYTVKFNSTTLYSVGYGTRDALGRIVTKTETIQGETHTYVYGYDCRNPLSDVSKCGVAISHYDYDANGNRLTATRQCNGASALI